MIDIINKIIELIQKHPKFTKFSGYLLVFLSLLYLVLQLCSCSLVRPSVENNSLGAEGVVSKEKNVSRTTKWYYKDPSFDNDM